jgi:hypothetical protein
VQKKCAGAWLHEQRCTTPLTVSAGLQQLEHGLQAQDVHSSNAQHDRQPVHAWRVEIKRQLRELLVGLVLLLP